MRDGSTHPPLGPSSSKGLKELRWIWREIVSDPHDPLKGFRGEVIDSRGDRGSIADIARKEKWKGQQGGFFDFFKVGNAQPNLAVLGLCM